MGGAKERRGERDEKVCIIDAVQYNTTIQIHGLMQTWSSAEWIAYMHKIGHPSSRLWYTK